MPTAGATPHHVVALALDGVVLLDLAAPTHLFGHCGAPYYSLELAAVTPGPVRSSTGLEVLARHGLEALARADTVVVAGVGPD
ncbi:MAG: AraC family transcriptional regulator, partial [Solirubrobacteraceae bacterium]